MSNSQEAIMSMWNKAFSSFTRIFLPSLFSAEAPFPGSTSDFFESVGETKKQEDALSAYKISHSKLYFIVLEVTLNSFSSLKWVCLLFSWCTGSHWLNIFRHWWKNLDAVRHFDGTMRAIYRNVKSHVDLLFIADLHTVLYVVLRCWSHSYLMSHYH